MTVTSGGKTFVVDLSDSVTINQPQCPPRAEFKISNSAFTGTVPSSVYSQDGETITLTLPSSQTWTEAKSSTTNGSFVVQSGYPKNETVYTTRSETSGCDTKYFYTPYTKTTTVSVASSSTTSWTRTWTITGWKIGNTTYGLGETITVTGNQTINAVITYTDSPKTTANTTTTRTEYYYTSAGSEAQGNAPGTTIDSSERKYTQSSPYKNDVTN